MSWPAPARNQLTPVPDSLGKRDVTCAAAQADGAVVRSHVGRLGRRHHAFSAMLPQQGQGIALGWQPATQLDGRSRRTRSASCRRGARRRCRRSWTRSGLSASGAVKAPLPRSMWQRYPAPRKKLPSRPVNACAAVQTPCGSGRPVAHCFGIDAVANSMV